MAIVFAAMNSKPGSESSTLERAHLRAFESRSCRKMHYGNRLYILQQPQAKIPKRNFGCAANVVQHACRSEFIGGRERQK